MKTQRDCTECGAPVGIKARTLCCRCWRRQQEAAARRECPDCGKSRPLTDAGRCKACSHTCTECGAIVRRNDRARCKRCHRRAQMAEILQLCGSCQRPRRLDPATGRCGTCDGARGPRPWRACADCGQLKVHRPGARCDTCWQRDPDRPFVYAHGLAGRLDDPPEWLADFAGHAAARFAPSRAVGVLRELGRLLADGERRPPVLLELARWDGPSMGPLARTLESFFLERRLALPTDQDERLAADRRARRIAAVPERFRPAVAAFANAQLAARDRARRAGTLPRSHHTIDTILSTVRDLARFLIDRHPAVTGWESVNLDHVEDFLTVMPRSRHRRLGSLRIFFTWARRHRVVLIEPTRELRTNPRSGFIGPVIDQTEQRRLLRRWANPDVHPHEAFAGLMAMLHAASCEELRHLLIDEVHPASRTITRLGRRPHPVPLAPTTWAALQRCLDHHTDRATPNPHLLVTKLTATRNTAASGYYLTHLLHGTGVGLRSLRSNRIAHLIATTDPLMVISALGLTPAAATWYLRDTVDEDRIPADL